MRHLIRASTGIAVFAPFLMTSCITSSAAKLSGEQRVRVQDLQITGEAIRVLEGRTVILRSRIDKAPNGAFAVYPQGKEHDEEDRGPCIDLVLRPELRNELRSKEGQIVDLTGHFVFVKSLPDYVASLSIEDTQHTPECQIFSRVSPYPYFVVDSIN